MTRRGFIGIAFAITLLALILRLTYFFSTPIQSPIRGDVVEYVNYAWNLAQHGTFSSADHADPRTGQWPPDAFRGPGYPAFLAFWMWLTGGGNAGYLAAVLAQILLGALTVALTIAWSRQWLSPAAALSAGLVTALWPHAIAFSGTLLSETVFGTTLLAFLLFASWSARDGKRRWAILAGLAGGLAYLVNPVALLFPPLVAFILFLHRGRQAAVVLLSLHLLMVGAWAARNAAHPNMPGAWNRASANLVEGSWPLYHAAYAYRFDEPVAMEMMKAISVEEKLMAEKPAEGFKAILGRMSNDPLGFARWYLLQKPYLLWGWQLGIGAGDVYFLETSRSPFDHQVPFRMIRAIYRYATPVLFAGALFASLIAFRRRWRDSDRGGAAMLFASLFFIYITGVHTVFQADPRYAVAYRPVEAALAVTACVAIAEWLRRRKPQPATT
jgi:4-amino-4-deoxy-L-arabinose transferase-like glycosyltransferase